jgi:hypothetical protein
MGDREKCSEVLKLKAHQSFTVHLWPERPWALAVQLEAKVWRVLQRNRISRSQLRSPEPRESTEPPEEQLGSSFHLKIHAISSLYMSHYHWKLLNWVKGARVAKACWIIRAPVGSGFPHKAPRRASANFALASQFSFFYWIFLRFLLSWIKCKWDKRFLICFRRAKKSPELASVCLLLSDFHLREYALNSFWLLGQTGDPALLARQWPIK